jgi:hypothetical protein
VPVVLDVDEPHERERRPGDDERHRHAPEHLVDPAQPARGVVGGLVQQ